MYQVVRVPKEGGVVYTITPVDYLTKVKNVHCSLLKGRVQKQPTAIEAVGGSRDPITSESLSDEEMEL